MVYMRQQTSDSMDTIEMVKGSPKPFDSHTNSFDVKENTYSPMSPSTLQKEPWIVHETEDNRIEAPRSTATVWTCFAGFGWWWEIGGTLVSVVAVALIVGILLVMDNKPLKDWSLPIQPNSLIAICTTLSKTALLVPVAGCISELKWSYFQRPRRLGALQAFDDASRGPWGSLTFLFRVHGAAWLGWLGAIITLLSLAFEPLTQQVIQFSGHDIPLQNVTGYVDQARAWSNYNISAWMATNSTTDRIQTNSITDMLNWEILVATSSAFGLLNNTGALPILSSPGFYCPTSTCRMPAYTTLATCGQCRFMNSTGYDNMEYFYSANAGGKDYTGIYRSTLMPLFDQYPDLTWENVTSECRTKSIDGYAIAETKWLDLDVCTTSGNVSANRDDDGPLGPYFSVDNMRIPPGSKVSFDNLARYTAFQTFNSNPSTANSSQDPCAERRAEFRLCSLDLCAEHHEEVIIKDGKLPKANIKKVPFKRFVNDTVHPDYFRATIDGKTGEESFLLEIAGISGLISDISGVYNTLGDMFTPGGIHDPGWDTYMNSVSDYLTNRIQSPRNPNVTSLPIEAYSSETYVEVHWPWLVLPLAIVAFSALLLLFTMIESAKRGHLFKSSMLATLFHGLDGWSERDLHGNEKWSSGRETEDILMQRANGMKAVLQRNQDGHLRLMKRG